LKIKKKYLAKKIKKMAVSDAKYLLLKYYAAEEILEQFWYPETEFMKEDEFIPLCVIISCFFVARFSKIVQANWN
jgi:hypothetical protein